MGSEELRGALQKTDEIDLTVTGRKSGQESSRPVWFVEEGEKLLLLPVTGSDSNWFKNLQKTPAIGLTAEGADLHANAKTLDNPDAVDHVVEAFGAKYGADRVDEYYPKHDVAVEVPLA
jgi:deazaflavin-dependent oxidoreductase (nitroreductase family)